MNSACWPLAVCSTTHGSILSALVRGMGGLPWPIAGEEPIAANAAIAAAAKNNEETMCRHGNGVNMRFDFVISESSGNLLIFVLIGVSFIVLAFFEFSSCRLRP